MLIMYRLLNQISYQTGFLLDRQKVLYPWKTTGFDLSDLKFVPCAAISKTLELNS